MSRSSDLEATFDFYWRVSECVIEPVAEYRFHPTRRWRFDRAFPEARVAVELEGMAGRSGKSRHTSFTGYQRDCDKYNAAQLHGWLVLRYTIKHFDDPRAVIEQIQAALRLRAADN